MASGGRGCGTEFAVELLDSAKAAVACAGNHQAFVNESEAVIGRFCNALQRFKYQKFSDERQILEQIRDKDVLVHFLFDCVRNRFLYSNRVGQAKQHLIEGSSVWDKAFKDHLSLCETCRSVGLRMQEMQTASDSSAGSSGKFPIPHCLELLALGALLLPLFVWWKGDDCHTHWLWLLLALLLMLPLFALMFALRVRPGRGKMLSYFIAGRYSGTEHYRRLGLFWAPSHAQLLEPPASEDVREKKMACFSFGWWSRQSKLIDNTRVTVSEAVLTTDQDIIYPIKVSSDTCRWRLAPGELQADGSLTGLAREARFDGSSVEIFGPGDRRILWTKIGCRRLDFIFRLATVLAVVGLCALIAMLFFPPGLDFKCFFGGTAMKRLPLRAVFLLDASGSVSTDDWNAEKKATETIIESFEEVYGSFTSGLLHLGLAQFTATAYPVVNITSDIGSVVAKLGETGWREKGGTEFKPALHLCLEELEAYDGAGHDTFDVCVLITDGGTDDNSLPVPADTALFGIYVGDSDKSADKLRSLCTCGRADHSSSCHYFARAANFQDLKDKSHEVADNIKKGADSAGGHEEPVEQPGYLPLFFLLLLPFLVWWVYLLFEKMPFRQAQNTTLGTPLRDPWRMRTVGMNEARTPEITPQISMQSRR